MPSVCWNWRLIPSRRIFKSRYQSIIYHDILPPPFQVANHFTVAEISPQQSALSSGWIYPLKVTTNSYAFVSVSTHISNHSDWLKLQIKWRRPPSPQVSKELPCPQFAGLRMGLISSEFDTRLSYHTSIEMGKHGEHEKIWVWSLSSPPWLPGARIDSISSWVAPFGQLTTNSPFLDIDFLGSGHNHSNVVNN